MFAAELAYTQVSSLSPSLATIILAHLHLRRLHIIPDKNNCHPQQKCRGVHRVDTLILKIIFPQIRVKSHWLTGMSFNLILPLIALHLPVLYKRISIFRICAPLFTSWKVTPTGGIKMTTRTFFISIPDVTPNLLLCFLKYPTTSSHFNWGSYSCWHSLTLSFKLRALQLSTVFFPF